jgi:hypothetical protein
MQAFLCGYMGGRGWTDEALAEQASFGLGRALRHQVRALGLRLDDLSPLVVDAIDDTLRDIVKMGIEEGKGDKGLSPGPGHALCL